MDADQKYSDTEEFLASVNFESRSYSRGVV